MRFEEKINALVEQEVRRRIDESTNGEGVTFADRLRKSREITQRHGRMIKRETALAVYAKAAINSFINGERNVRINVGVDLAEEVMEDLVSLGFVVERVSLGVLDVIHTNSNKQEVLLEIDEELLKILGDDVNG